MSEKKTLYCIHIPAARNVGDACSAPYAHVGELSERFEIKVFSIANHERIQSIPTGAPIIMGGGGLLASKPVWDESFRIALDRSDQVIAWGLGLNRPPPMARKAPLALPAFTSEFAMMGIRDIVPDTRWVPCVSCLYSGFDAPAAASPRHKIGFYLHVQRTEKLPESLHGLMETVPVMTNGGDKNSLGEVIQFLSSCDNIITNSFHGMYWATLLGKKVLLFDVFSEKFTLSPWSHPVYDPEQDVDAQFEAAPLYPGALEEARAANISFRDDVLDFL